jgi:hypothetical protein
VAGGGGVEGERRRGRGVEEEGSQGGDAGGALGVNRRGAAGNGGVGGEIGGIWENRRKCVGVIDNGAPGVGLVL